MVCVDVVVGVECPGGDWRVSGDGGRDAALGVETLRAPHRPRPVQVRAHQARPLAVAVVAVVGLLLLQLLLVAVAAHQVGAGRTLHARLY